MLKRNRQRGFTLIELLIVVAIIGIIAAILIPNLIDALQKAKQKRTVSDLRNVGTSIMSWVTDQVGAASAGQRPYNASTGAGFGTKTYGEIANYLNSFDNDQFFYMQEVPEFDGWKSAYTWAFNTNLLAGNVYIMCSPGRDGVYDIDCNETHTDTGAFIATDYDSDLAFADGFLIKYPGNVRP